MRRLHSSWTGKSSENPGDREFREKVARLQWVSPKQFGVPRPEEVFKQRSWTLAIKRLKTLKHLRSPALKMKAVIAAINILQLSYKVALGHRKEAYASTDDLFPSLVFVICQARLETPFSTEKLIEVFEPCRS